MSRMLAITCATGGLGQAIAERLILGGNDLMLAGRNEEKLAGLRDRLIASADQRVDTVNVDFGSSESLKRLAKARGSQSFDGLVLMYPRVRKLPQIIPDADDHAAVWQECFFRPLECLRLLLENMADDARVVVVSGISNTQIFPSLGISNVIRAAWLAEVKLLGFRLADRRIRINTVSLGGTLTDRFVQNLSQAGPPGPLDDQIDVIPLREHGQPSNVAEIVHAMLGGFSDHMTGANIVCDGGLTRHYA